MAHTDPHAIDRYRTAAQRDREADAAMRFRDEALRFMRERDDALAEVERLREENESLKRALHDPCPCVVTCGDRGDPEGPGICKGLPR